MKMSYIVYWKIILPDDAKQIVLLHKRKKINHTIHFMIEKKVYMLKTI